MLLRRRTQAFARPDSERYLALLWNKAPMTWQPFITSSTEIARGKPIVQGTRLTVEFVLGLYTLGSDAA